MQLYLSLNYSFRYAILNMSSSLVLGTQVFLSTLGTRGFYGLLGSLGPFCNMQCFCRWQTTCRVNRWIKCTFLQTLRRACPFEIYVAFHIQRFIVACIAVMKKLLVWCAYLLFPYFLFHFLVVIILNQNFSILLIAKIPVCYFCFETIFCWCLFVPLTSLARPIWFLYVHLYSSLASSKS